MNRIQKTFNELISANRAALMPYLPLGYPTRDISRELVRTVAEAGADVVELGIPFSDPLADGPTIQHATQVALKNGMTLAICLDEVKIAREAGVAIPIVLMGYYNPLLRFGVEKFVLQAVTVGADGLIVPDVPLEEAESLQHNCERSGLDLIYLAAPTSTGERLKRIADATGAFLYLVSIAGVTGARDSLPVELDDFVRRVRAVTNKPLCVGFGISSASNARHVAEIADGVIVGSAIVEKIGDPSSAVLNAGRFIRELRDAIDKARIPAPQ